MKIDPAQLTQEHIRRIKSVIAECDRFIAIEGPRRPDLRPADIQQHLDFCIAHRANMKALIGEAVEEVANSVREATEGENVAVSSKSTSMKYGRNDVDYATWYTPWMKTLAKSKTAQELSEMLKDKGAEAKKAGASHLRAIQSTGSMQGCSARRAGARNVVSAAGDAAIAIRGAIEIHELFPEFAK